MKPYSLLSVLSSLLLLSIAAPAAVVLLPEPTTAQEAPSSETDAARFAEAVRLFQQGIQQYQVSQFREALVSWQRALAIYQDPSVQAAFPQESRQGEGAALGNLGNAYLSLGQYPEAIALYEQVLVITREIGDRQGEGGVLGNLGSAYLNLGQYQEAIALYEQRLVIAREIGDRQGEGNTLGNLGIAYANLGQYQEAIALYGQVLVITREIGNRQGEGNTLGNLGVAYSNLGQYQEAIALYEQHLVIAREIGDRQGEGAALGNLGAAYRDLGQYQEAIALYEQVLVITREIGDRRGEGATLGNLGVAYADLGQYQEAIALYEQRLVIAREIGDRQGEGNTLGNLGIAYANLGQYQGAIALYEQVLVITREIGDRQGEGNTLGNLGVAYADLGQYQEAIALYEQVLVITREIGNRQGEGNTLGNLGVAYSNLGQYQEAIALYEQRLAITREIGDRRGEASALGNLGVAYRNLGQYQEAIAFFEQQLVITREIGDRQGEGNTLGNLGNAYNNLGQDQEAIVLYEQVLVIAREIGDRRSEGNALNNLGIAYANLGQHQDAVDLYEQVLVITREIGDRRGEGNTLGNLGLTYADLGRHQEAVDLYEQVLVITREIGNRRGEGYALNNLGMAYNNLGYYPQASDVLFAAIEVEESLRNEEIPDAQQISFFDTQLSAYINLQRALVAQGNIDSALEVAERGRARPFVLSLLRQQEDSPIAPLPNLADIRRIAQQENATLVQYSDVSFREDETPQLFIWVVQPTGEIHFQSVDLSSFEQNLDDLVTTTRQLLNVRSRNDAEVIISLTPEAQAAQRQRQTEALQALHQLLIDPIASYLPDAPEERIIFIPHQSLYLVPFPALMDANGDYLIEHHTMLTAPSIQVLDLIRQPSSTTADALTADDLLLVGNPIMPRIWNPSTGQSEQLSSLPGTEQEAAAIQSLLGATPLLWEAASEATVKAQMPTAQVIHLATHGLLDYGDPQETGVLDFPGAIALAPGDGEDGLLTSAEILQMDLRAELVVLSACDTGRGRITGDGVVGLSRAFMQAGVPSLIVSLWKVPDEATAFLMTEFYENWQTTPDRAQALRQAMLTTMEQEEYADPLNWAGFTLIGQAE
ncbi:MAG: CHAT domain-containing tetratricopeptide repeat protein [Cyanobacteria bacterium J06638_22]